MQGLVPIKSERAAYETACQHRRREVSQIDGEYSIAYQTKSFDTENVDIQKDDRGAD